MNSYDEELLKRLDKAVAIINTSDCSDCFKEEMTGCARRAKGLIELGDTTLVGRDTANRVIGISMGLEVSNNKAKEDR